MVITVFEGEWDMSELSDWKRHIYEPEKEAFEVTIKALRNEITRLTTELAGARAAMAKEAAEWHSKQIEEISRLLRHGNANSDGEIQMVMERIFHGTSNEAILALADMPAGYVAVNVEPDDDAVLAGAQNIADVLGPNNLTFGEIAKNVYHAMITKAAP
jgi:hypothetical protein